MSVRILRNSLGRERGSKKGGLRKKIKSRKSNFSFTQENNEELIFKFRVFELEKRWKEEERGEKWVVII